MAIVGIDIGTCYSSICVLDANGRAERVKVATGTGIFGDSYSLPSAVFAEDDGRLLLGQSAMANRMRRPENFKGEFKRDLGQFVPYQLGGREYYPQDLYKEFFIYLKRCAETYLNESVGKATITCPAAFNKSKKQLVLDAAMRAGLLEAELLDEPSAAAFGYWGACGFGKGDTLLVYDLGGGTFDVALLRCTGEGFEPMALPMGLPNSGGMDFDKLIFDHIMDQIGEERLAPIRANALFSRKFSLLVMELAVRAKHHLSSADVFNDVIPVGYDTVDYTLSRGEYNAMISPIINGTMLQVRDIIKNAGITEKDVTAALLVGGGSRTPVVGENLARLFGKEPLRNIDPELAVCSGAAVYRKGGNPAPQPGKAVDTKPASGKTQPKPKQDDANGQEIEKSSAPIGISTDLPFVTEDGWIYYINKDEDYELYRVRVDGTDKDALAESVYGFAVIGDWIFCNTLSEECEECFSKVRTNGSGLRSHEITDSVDNFVVVGDWIYYSHSHGDEYGLCKVRTSGTGRKELIDDKIHRFIVSGDWIYYISASDDYSLCKIRTNGAGAQLLTDDAVSKVDDLIVSGGWIYYCNESDHYNWYRIRTDGTRKALVTDDGYCKFIDDWAYFHEDDCVYKMRTDTAGMKKTKITDMDDSIKVVAVAGDWIFYTNDDDDESLYKMRANGTGKKKITDDKATVLKIIGDWIYYLDNEDDDSLYRIRTDGKGEEWIDLD